MKTRLLIVAAVALCVCIAIKPRRVAAQSPQSFFTIAFVPDIHYDFTTGLPNPINQNKWNHGIRPWILTHMNDLTWNLRGVVGLGDMVSENNGVTPADWDTMMANWREFWDAGLVTVAAPGNHDADCVSATSFTTWSAKWGPTIKGWTTLFPSNMILALDEYSPFFSGGACTPAAATQYARVDVPTTIGTIKLALTTTMIFPTANALDQLNTQANVDTDRNVLVGTHMFLGATFATVSTNSGAPCVSGTSLCGPYPAYSLRQTGDNMWARLKTWPRLVGIANGHLHEETGNDGYHSAALTGDAGNPVQAVSVGQQWGVLVLATFRTDNHTIEWRAWDTCRFPASDLSACQAPDQGHLPGGSTGTWNGITGGAVTLIEPWTPILTATGNPGISGKVTGKIK